MFEKKNVAEFQINNKATVVTNDKRSDAEKTVVKTDISGATAALFMLEQISNDRESWEANEYAASRKRLYQLLTQCYEYYITLKLSADKAIREEHKKALYDFCGQRGYKFQGKTHDMHRIVKAVFGGSDRRRISAYAQALVVALTAGAVNDKGVEQAVMSSELASWIESQGGIEEIRTGSKNAGMSRSEQAQAAFKTLDDCDSLATIKADFKTYGVDSNDTDKQMLLVVTYRNTGEFEINALIKEQSALNEALACFYKNNLAKKSEFSKADSATQSSLKQTETA